MPAAPQVRRPPPGPQLRQPPVRRIGL